MSGMKFHEFSSPEKFQRSAFQDNSRGKFQRKIPGKNSRGKPFGKIPGRYLGDFTVFEPSQILQTNEDNSDRQSGIIGDKAGSRERFPFFFFWRTFFAFIHINLNILSLRSKLCNTDFTKSVCCQVQAPISFPFSA